MLPILQFVLLTLARETLLILLFVVNAGPIPSTFGGLVGLVGLNLRSNQLTGKCGTGSPFFYQRLHLRPILA